MELALDEPGEAVELTSAQAEPLVQEPSRLGTHRVSSRADPARGRRAVHVQKRGDAIDAEPLRVVEPEDLQLLGAERRDRVLLNSDWYRALM